MERIHFFGERGIGGSHADTFIAPVEPPVEIFMFRRYFGGYYTCFKFDEIKPATSKQRMSFLINQHRCKLSYKYLGILREGFFFFVSASPAPRSGLSDLHDLAIISYYCVLVFTCEVGTISIIVQLKAVHLHSLVTDTRTDSTYRASKDDNPWCFQYAS